MKRWLLPILLAPLLLWAAAAFAAPDCDCDLNNDGRVDLIDVQRARVAYMQGAAGDVNGDLRTDLMDINLIRAHFGAVAVGAVAWDVQEQAIYALLNDYRAHPERWKQVLDAQGNRVEPDRTRVLQPVAPGYRLSQAAQWMASDCAQYHYLSHTDRLGRDSGARIVAYWYEARSTWMGEIAGTAPPEQIFELWTLSPGHNGILISPYASIGIGHDIADDGTHYWFADFSSGVDMGFP